MEQKPLYEQNVTRDELVSAIGMIALARPSVRAVAEKAATASKVELIVDGEVIARVNVT